VLLQTVVLDYVQSEIHLKSSRDKSQLDLASMCSRPAHTAQRLEAACNCQSLFLLQRMLADMICALLSDEWFVCHVHTALPCTRCWCGHCAMGLLGLAVLLCTGIIVHISFSLSLCAFQPMLCRRLPDQ